MKKSQKRTLLSVIIILIVLVAVYMYASRRYNVPISSYDGGNKLSETEAKNIAIKYAVESKQTSLSYDCLDAYATQTTNTKIFFDLREKHNKICGGDLDTSPRITSVVVNLYTKKVIEDTPDTSSLDLTLQSNYYINKNLGFKIKLPSGWNVDQEDESGIIFYNDTLSANADFGITKENLGTYTLESYVQNTKNRISEYQSVKFDAITVEKTMVNSRPTYILRWTVPQYEEDGYEFQAHDYIECIQAKSNVVYNISTDFSQSISMPYKAVLESSLRTFTIL